jgi:hypothetical protein
MTHTMAVIIAAAKSECINAAFVAAIHDRSASTGICAGTDTPRYPQTNHL